MFILPGFTVALLSVDQQLVSLSHFFISTEEPTKWVSMKINQRSGNDFMNPSRVFDNCYSSGAGIESIGTVLSIKAFQLTGLHSSPQMEPGAFLINILSSMAEWLKIEVATMAFIDV